MHNKLKYKSPFLLCALSGIIALFSDLAWLILDIFIKTTDYEKYPISYIFILSMLSLSILLMMYSIYHHFITGLSNHEIGIQEEYRTQKKIEEKREKNRLFHAVGK